MLPPPFFFFSFWLALQNMERGRREILAWKRNFVEDILDFVIENQRQQVFSCDRQESKAIMNVKRKRDSHGGKAALFHKYKEGERESVNQSMDNDSNSSNRDILVAYTAPAGRWCNTAAGLTRRWLAYRTSRGWRWNSNSTRLKAIPFSRHCIVLESKMRAC